MIPDDPKDLIQRISALTQELNNATRDAARDYDLRVEITLEEFRMIGARAVPLVQICVFEQLL